MQAHYFNPNLVETPAVRKGDIGSDIRKGWDLLNAHQAEDAEDTFSQCCALDPENAKVWFLLGIARHRQQKFEPALLAFLQAAKFSPGNVEAYNAQASMLVSMCRYDEALDTLFHALKYDRRCAKTLANTGTLLMHMGQPSQSLKYLNKALSIDNELIDALISRGLVLAQLEMKAAALDNNQRLLAMDPESAESHFACAEVYLTLRYFHETVQYADKALEIAPNHVQSLVNRGIAWAALGRLAKSTDDFMMARRVDSHAADAHCHVWQEKGWPFTGDLPDPVLLYIAAGIEQQRRCDWTQYSEFAKRYDFFVSESLQGNQTLCTPSIVFSSLTLPIGNETRLGLARGVANRLRQEASFRTTQRPFQRRYEAPRRLRVGYLLGRHPQQSSVVHIMAQLAKRHDRDHIDVSCYLLTEIKDQGTYQALERYSDSTHCLHAQEADFIASTIHADDIHLLVDLSGFHCSVAPSILARQPAPVQVGYFGYPGTLSADFIPYRITDQTITPIGTESLWAEKLVYLPGSCLLLGESCLETRPCASRNEMRLPEQGLVFCCFNQGYAIEPQVFASWLDLLKRVPDSVLWLQQGPGDMTENLRQHANDAGIQPERLHFSPVNECSERSRCYAIADLYLDTGHINSQLIACEALSNGLPVLTCVGLAAQSRVSASLLEDAGVSSLVTRSLGDYEDRAYFLATHPEYLNVLRRKIARYCINAQKKTTQKKIAYLEQAYKRMWQQFANKQEPTSFFVGE